MPDDIGRNGHRGRAMVSPRKERSQFRMASGIMNIETFKMLKIQSKMQENDIKFVGLKNL